MKTKSKLQVPTDFTDLLRALLEAQGRPQGALKGPQELQKKKNTPQRTTKIEALRSAQEIQQKRLYKHAQTFIWSLSAQTFIFGFLGLQGLAARFDRLQPLLPCCCFGLPMDLDAVATSDCFPSGPNEYWTLYNNPKDLISIAVEFIEAICRCILFTVPPHYLLCALYYSKPIVVVRNESNLILGFGFLNMETHSFPEETMRAWDGQSALKQQGKHSKADYSVAHLSIFGVSAFASRTLGSRLMLSLKQIACSLGAEYIVIEALSPLKKYYQGRDFQTASSAFLKSSGAGLVPMLFKTEASDAFCTIVLDSPVVSCDTINSICSSTKMPEALEESNFLNAHVSAFLSNRDALKAGLALRSIAQRSQMTPEEYQKLWNFRNKCLCGRKVNEYELFSVVEKF